MNNHSELISGLRDRVFVLDGAMGTVLQDLGVNFKVCDSLNLTHPELVEKVHRQYVEAGADIICTNTFNSNSISLSKYKLESATSAANYQGALIARKVADSANKTVFVAGSIGPTSSLSFLGDVSFDELVEAYSVQVENLINYVDIFLVETITDPLNTKAALYAISKVQEKFNTKRHLMVSVSPHDRFGNLFVGQSIKSFANAVMSYNPLSFGINCSNVDQQGFKNILTKLQELPCFVSAYPQHKYFGQ